jgi:hypothetical protein
MARLLARVQERLGRVGARLVLVPYKQSDVHREVRAELLRGGVSIPVIPLLERMEKEDQLGHDAHPSPAAVRAFALWIAGSLIESGWLLAAPARALPEVEPRYAGRRTRELADEELLAWSRERRARNEAALEAVISTATLRGTCQIYGGLNLDATLEPVFACALPPGKRLSVHLAPLAARPDLYPLEVRVVVNDRPLGVLTVGGEGTTRQAFDLSAEEGRGPFEVRLEALDWAVVSVLGRSWVAAAKLLELASLSE